MIRHIVAFRLNSPDEAQRQADITAMKARLEALKCVIPGVLELTFGGDRGLVPGHWHAVLVSDYPDNSVLEAYQAHPAHVEVLTWLNAIVADRAVIDYEFA